MSTPERILLIGGPRDGDVVQVPPESSYLVVELHPEFDNTYYYYRRTYWPGPPFVYVDVMLYTDHGAMSRHEIEASLLTFWEPTVKLRAGGGDWPVTEPRAPCGHSGHTIGDHLPGGAFAGVPLDHKVRPV